MGTRSSRHFPFASGSQGCVQITVSSRAQHTNYPWPRKRYPQTRGDYGHTDTQEEEVFGAVCPVALRTKGAFPILTQNVGNAVRRVAMGPHPLPSETNKCPLLQGDQSRSLPAETLPKHTLSRSFSFALSTHTSVLEFMIHCPAESIFFFFCMPLLLSYVSAKCCPQSAENCSLKSFQKVTGSVAKCDSHFKAQGSAGRASHALAPRATHLVGF